MLKAAIFDLDGTITVLTLPLDAMRRDTKTYFIERGLPESVLDPADGITSTTMKAKEYFLNHGISHRRWTVMSAEVDALLNAHEGSAAEDVELIDGSLDAVGRIRDSGMKTAILTNNGRHAVNIIMQRIPLDKYFDLIQTRNECPSPKPFPEGIRDTVSKLSVKMREAVYIGDARIDGAAAGRAGIEFWGVATGETPPEVLTSAGASRVFRSLSEVADALLKPKLSS